MATLSANTTFSYSAAGSSWTAFGNTISAPAVRSKINKVALGVGTGNVREYMPGVIIEHDDAKAVIEYAKAEYALIAALRGTPYFWKITYADGSTNAFQGFIIDCGMPEMNAEADDRITYDLTIALTTVITFTAGT